MRLAVLVSGGGTNLQAILDAVAGARLAAEIALVVSSRPGVEALERARAAGIETLVVESRRFGSREAHDAELVRHFEERRVELIVLAGYMRIVTPVLLTAFRDRVVNIHPSLLPAFPGLDAQRQALEAGVAIAGCTVHLVDAGTDTGPIIAQAAVPVLADDNVASLRARILAEEHRILPAVLQWFADGIVQVVEGDGGARRVRVSGDGRMRCFAAAREGA